MRMFTGFAVASSSLLWVVALRSAILLGLWQQADFLLSVSLLAGTVAIARFLVAVRCSFNCSAQYDSESPDLEAPPNPPPLSRHKPLLHPVEKENRKEARQNRKKKGDPCGVDAS